MKIRVILSNYLKNKYLFNTMITTQKVPKVTIFQK